MRLSSARSRRLLLVSLFSLSLLGCASRIGSSPTNRAHLAPADTNRPVVPDEPAFPVHPLFVTVRGEQIIRNSVEVRLADSLSGISIMEFLHAFNATIIGGWGKGTYVLEIPDPGPSWQDLNSVLTEMRAWPGVEGVSDVVITTSGDSRFITDSTPAYTSRPALPTTPHPDDSMFVVLPPDPADSGWVYYRRIAMVIFEDTLSGNDVRSYFDRFEAEIVGGGAFSGGYIVMIPDPGPTWNDFQAKLNEMRAVSGVDLVVPLTRIDRGPTIPFSPRGGTQTGQAQLAPADTSRPAVPDHWGLPAERLYLKVGGDLIIRNVVQISFSEPMTGAEITAFLEEFNATIIGGLRLCETYILEIPDPGTTWSDLNAVLLNMRAWPDVELVGSVSLTTRMTSSDDSAQTRQAQLAPADTSRPAVPSEPGLPSQPLHLLDDGALIIRNAIQVRFADSTSGSTIREFLDAFDATIVGGRGESRYIVEIPDPGTTMAEFVQVLDAMLAWPCVENLADIELSTRVNGGFPNDSAALGASRNDMKQLHPRAAAIAGVTKAPRERRAKTL